MVDDRASALDVGRFNDFYVYQGEYGKQPVRWYAASDGIATMRTLITYYEKHPYDLPESQFEMVMSALNTLADILEEADIRDIRFCLLGDY